MRLGTGTGRCIAIASAELSAARASSRDAARRRIALAVVSPPPAHHGARRQWPSRRRSRLRGRAVVVVGAMTASSTTPSCSPRSRPARRRVSPPRARAVAFAMLARDGDLAAAALAFRAGCAGSRAEVPRDAHVGIPRGHRRAHVWPRLRVVAASCLMTIPICSIAAARAPLRRRRDHRVADRAGRVRATHEAMTKTSRSGASSSACRPACGWRSACCSC